VSSNVTVLHVDDNPAVLDVSSTFAEGNDIRWLTASRPATGLSVLADHDVDCLVADSVHTAEGVPFVLRATEAVPDLPVVLYTASDRDAVGLDVRDVAAGHVQKGTPDQFPTLLAHVRSRVRNTRDGAHESASSPVPSGDAETAAWHPIGSYDWSDGDTDLSTVIVTAVESETGQDASKMPPLYESVDPEVLETLLHRPYGESPSGVRVQFSFLGRTLAVTSGGRVLMRADSA
jgi:CheY-like chemotaxis protein